VRSIDRLYFSTCLKNTECNALLMCSPSRRFGSAQDCKALESTKDVVVRHLRQHTLYLRIKGSRSLKTRAATPRTTRSCRFSKLINPLPPCHLGRDTRWKENFGCKLRFRVINFLVSLWKCFNSSTFNFSTPYV
jgi:hypothetical protein